MQLKNGETLSIAHTRPQDAAAIIDYLNIIGGESET